MLILRSAHEMDSEPLERISTLLRRFFLRFKGLAANARLLYLLQVSMVTDMAVAGVRMI